MAVDDKTAATMAVAAVLQHLIKSLYEKNVLSTQEVSGIITSVKDSFAGTDMHSQVIAFMDSYISERGDTTTPR